MAVIVVCALWWSYFAWVHPVLEDAMANAEQLGRFARDVFSFAHFPLVGGVIAFAAGAEEAVAHPEDALGIAPAIALTVGVALFVASTWVALMRSGERPPPHRALAGILVLALIPVLASTSGLVAIAIVAVVVSTMVLVEPEPMTSHSG